MKNKARVTKLESDKRVKSHKVAPIVFMDNGIYTDDSKNLLTKNKDGELIREDGTLFYEGYTDADMRIQITFVDAKKE